MTTLEILQACCHATADMPFAMDKPFRRGGYVYATNGHIAARTLAANLPDAGEVAKAPPIEKYAFTPDGEALEIPAEVVWLDSAAACPSCNRRGYCSCKECGHQHECTVCHGDGEGQAFNFRIGPQILGIRYLKLLLRFGVREIRCPNGYKPCFWKLGDVDGLLMPRRDDFRVEALVGQAAMPPERRG